MRTFLQRHRFELIAIGLMAAAVGWTFGGTSRNAFLDWDDGLIFDNPNLDGLTWRNIQWALTDCTTHKRHIYMPLSWLWWMLVNQTLGLTPAVYHAINLLVHCANSVLVFFLARTFLNRLAPDAPPQPESCRSEAAAFPKRLWPFRNASQRAGASTLHQDRAIPVSEGWRAVIPGIAALFWAIHPLRVEPVAWAITQKFLIATFLVLLSLFCHLRHIEIRGTRGPAEGWYGLSLACFAASLLFYPIALAWPAVVLLLELGWARLAGSTPGGWRRAIDIGWRLLPFAACSAIAAGIPFFLSPPPPEPTPAATVLQQAAHPAAAAAMAAAYIWVYFAWRPLFPVHLSPIYTTLLDFDPWSAPFVGSLLALIALTIVAWGLRRRFPWILALWLCHLALLVPMLGVGIHTENYPNDRYAYLEGIGWTLLLAGLLDRLAGAAKPARVRVAWLVPCGAALIALGVASHRQAAMWRDSAIFFQTLLRQPGIDTYRFDLHWRLAEHHLAHHRLPEAKAAVMEGLRIRPDDAVLLYVLALAYDDEGDLVRAEETVRRSLAVRSAPEAWRLLTRICIRAGRIPAAREAFAGAMAADPQDLDVHFLGAVLLLQAGNQNGALDVLERILAVDPAHAGARDLRAQILQHRRGH
jgi:cytochrome c-type biogenesis protein CcmH/NrfG